jgi:hypothetical protein
MSWYTQNNYQQINADYRSLTIAYANLLKKLNKELSPPELFVMLTEKDPVLDWWSIVDYMDLLNISEVSEEEGSWPPVDLAVIKFRRTDQAAAGPVDHYCLINDHSNGTIVDSLDGEIKHASVYGAVMGWASYTVAEEDQWQELEAQALAVAKPRPGSMYTVLKGGETCWNIALKLNVPNMNGEDIAHHNEIENPSLKVAEGTKLHLPIAIPERDTKQIINIELYSKPREMHVSLADGTRKQSFGIHKKWSDILPTGPTYAENTNLKILGVAKVPIEEEGIEAAYFLDTISLGNYANSGLLAQTTGFNHSHLKDGYVEKVIIKPQEDTPDPDPEPAPVEQQQLLPEPLEITTSQYKKTTPLNPQRIPEQYTNPKAIIVEDVLDGRLKPRIFEPWTVFEIYGTFAYKGVLYGRHVQSVESGNWLGIPMDEIVSERELHKTNDISLIDKKNMGNSLTLKQRYLWLPTTQLLGRYTWLKIQLGQKNKNNIKEKN